MAVDIEGLVGADNMNLAQRATVAGIIRGHPVPVTVKRYLYARWLRLVGHEPQTGELDEVGKLP